MRTLAPSLARNFLGSAPAWYKIAIVAFLALNPLLLLLAGPFATGWAFIAEFIFTLAMALTCYPLQPGGLLAIEAVLLGLTSAAAVFEETAANYSILLLITFMVAGIYFMRDLLLLIFTKLLVHVPSKMLLSLTFAAVAAVLSAFLDALTVAAVVLAVTTGFYTVYHRFASGRGPDDDHDRADDGQVRTGHHADLEQFRGFLRNLVMHAAVGTAMGGVATLVGEPQNLLIGETVGWNFMEFMVHVAPISIPVLLFGLATCALLEKARWFGYGAELPGSVRRVIVEWDTTQASRRTSRMRAKLLVQALTAVTLVVALALHVAEVGLIGLLVIVVATALNGVIDERAIGHAFEEALPFAALLVTFFAIVAVIHDQGLFSPVIAFVLGQDGQNRILALFGATGVLSAISDNVFVATVYITEIERSFNIGDITRDQFEQLAITVNVGTNVPSIATPNGQAAFLFILTSALAPLVRLGYLRMLWMALPYAVVLSAVTLGATVLFI